MLSPRWRKVLGDLLGNKTRTLLVVLSVAVGVFAVGMIGGTQALLTRSVDANWNAENPSSATLVTEPFDEDLLASIRQVPGVAHAEGRRVLDLRIQVQSTGEWKNLSAYAVPDYDQTTVDMPRPQYGAWPPPDHELVLERSSLPWLGVQMGDTLLVEGPDGSQREMSISGVAHAFHMAPAMLAGRASGFISRDTLEWLRAPHSFNVLALTVGGDGHDSAYVQQVVDRVTEKVERSGRPVLRQEVSAGKYFLSDIIHTFLLILGSLGILSVLLSGFLVVNTISALVTQQVRQIGVMKAIGARPSQITGMYLGMVLVYGFLALCVAVPLGSAAAAGLIDFAAGYLNFDVASYHTSPRVLVMQAAVGLIVPLLAALHPVISGARMTIREAISSYGLTNAGSGTGKEPSVVPPRWKRTHPAGQVWVAIGCALQAVTARLRQAAIARTPRPLMLSLRNTFRRQGRLVLTLGTLILAGAIFIAVFSVRNSLLVTLDQMARYQRYNVEIDFVTPYRIEEIRNVIRGVPGIGQTDMWGVASGFRVRPDGTETAKDIAILGIPSDTTLIRPTLLRGRWLLPEDENAIVVNLDTVEEEPDVGVGDWITLKINGRETPWRVVGVVSGQMTGPMAYAHYPHLARVMREVDRARRLVVVTNAHGMAYEAQVLETLEGSLDSAGMRVASSRTYGEARALLESQFNLIVVFLLIMSILMAIVGGLGLMGTMSLNVLERTREIGVMRAIGGTDRAILQLVIVEGVVIGVLSWVAGAVVGLPAGKLLSDAVGIEFLRNPLVYSYSFPGMSYWLVVVVIVAALASYLPAHRASRLTVRDVLAYE